MRRLIFPVIGMALALAACKHEAAAPAATSTPAAVPAPPPPVELVSVLNMNDPQAPTQLTKGFWGLENNAWRWTASKFAVTLRPPAGAAQNGARLEMKLTLPAGFLDTIGPMTLSASVGGVALDPEKYTKTGDYIFKRDVPASALSSDKVAIEFDTDKSRTPPGDRRELALIVAKVGLVAK